MIKQKIQPTSPRHTNPNIGTEITGKKQDSISPSKKKTTHLSILMIISENDILEGIRRMIITMLKRLK